MLKQYIISLSIIILYIGCEKTKEKFIAERLVLPDIELDSSKVALGKKLFFDPRLSQTNTIACASCHQPRFSFADNKAISPGIFNRRGTRNAPGIINPVFQKEFFHDGRALSLEEQAAGPLDNPLEMGRANEIPAKLNKVDEYRLAFQKLYADTVKLNYIQDAIAEFERSIIFHNSPYDRYMAGDKNALTEDQKEGMKVFFGKANCAECHNGPNFTDNDYHNIAFFHKNDPKSDKGRFDLTKQEDDLGKFKTPSLRNIALTAPYFHDGRSSDLRELIELYNKPNPMGPGELKDPKIKAIHLDEKEMYQLQEFLIALNSKDELLEYVPHTSLDSLVKRQRYRKEEFENRYYLDDYNKKIRFFKSRYPGKYDSLKLSKLSTINDSVKQRLFKIEIDKTYFRGKYARLFNNGDYLIFNQNQ